MREQKLFMGRSRERGASAKDKGRWRSMSPQSFESRGSVVLLHEDGGSSFD
jgi:hypothetical protein